MTRKEAQEAMQDIKEPFTRGYITAIIDGIYEDFEKQLKNRDFENLARDMIEYLNNNHHPHTRIIIDTTTAEIVEGVKCVHTVEFIKG